VTDWHSQTSAGSKFQVDGAMTKKTHRAMSLLVLGTPSIGK